MKHNASNADTWTGDFIVCKDEDYSGAVWPRAEMVVVESEQDVLKW